MKHEEETHEGIDYYSYPEKRRRGKQVSNTEATKKKKKKNHRRNKEERERPEGMDQQENLA